MTIKLEAWAVEKARQALYHGKMKPKTDFQMEQLSHVALALQAERESAAKIAESYKGPASVMSCDGIEIAKAIKERNRG